MIYTIFVTRNLRQAWGIIPKKGSDSKFRTNKLSPREESLRSLILHCRLAIFRKSCPERYPSLPLHPPPHNFLKLVIAPLFGTIPQRFLCLWVLKTYQKIIEYFNKCRQSDHKFYWNIEISISSIFHSDEALFKPEFIKYSHSSV